jgi:hypothetical protein
MPAARCGFFRRSLDAPNAFGATSQMGFIFVSTMGVYFPKLFGRFRASIECDIHPSTGKMHLR